MLTIFQIETDDHKSYVRELFWEYLQWANGRVNEEFGVNFDIQAMLEQDMRELNKFAPPDGRLLLGEEATQIAGCACLRKLSENVAEIKRMYVRPQHRGQGVGRSLLVAIIEQGRQIGYSTIRLDSARFMKEAHALYRTSGFQEIEPYPESEIPEDFRPNWVFMELTL